MQQAERCRYAQLGAIPFSAAVHRLCCSPRADSFFIFASRQKFLHIHREAHERLQDMAAHSRLRSRYYLNFGLYNIVVPRPFAAGTLLMSKSSSKYSIRSPSFRNPKSRVSKPGFCRLKSEPALLTSAQPESSTYFSYALVSNLYIWRN